MGLIEGGTAVNIVPDTCAATFDIRTVPGQDTTATLSALENFVRERVGERDGYELIFEPPYHDSPNFETPAGHPLVQTACELRDQPEADTVAFGCDGSKLAARDIPTIVLGPGDIAQAHTKDEHILLKDLEAGAVAYEHLAAALLTK